MPDLNSEDWFQKLPPEAREKLTPEVRQKLQDAIKKMQSNPGFFGMMGTLGDLGKIMKENGGIQGLKNMSEAIVPEIYDPSKLDRSIMIDTEEAFEMSRRIIREEGIFCGMSSGAAMLAALKVAEDIDRGLIVCIFPDRGEKYLSTTLFE